jgi:hypothetical protein
MALFFLSSMAASAISRKRSGGTAEASRKSERASAPVNAGAPPRRISYMVRNLSRIASCLPIASRSASSVISTPNPSSSALRKSLTSSSK